MRLPAALVLATLVLAGCGDDPQADVQDSAFSGLDDAASATATTGAIAGVVVDEAIRPVPNVNVTLLSSGAVSTTNNDGRFAFEGLDAGTYFLSAEAHRFEKAQVSADVLAGEVTTVRVLIARLTSIEPYHYTLPFRGFMDNYLGYANFVMEVIAPGTLPCTCAFDVSTDANLTTIMVEAVGQVTVENPGTPATVPGDAYWEVLGGGTDGVLVSSGYDEFPVVKRFTAADFAETPFDENGVIGVRITCGIWPCVQMNYDLYVTLWYHEEAPEGWSFLAENS